MSNDVVTFPSKPRPPRAPPVGNRGLLSYHIADRGEGWWLPLRVTSDGIPSAPAAPMLSTLALICTASAHSHVTRVEAERLGLVAGNVTVGATGSDLWVPTYPAVLAIFDPKDDFVSAAFRVVVHGYAGEDSLEAAGVSPLPFIVGRDFIEQLPSLQISGLGMMIAQKTLVWPQGGTELEPK